MATVRFDRATFESALPAQVVWQKLGLTEGEYAYQTTVKPGVHIMVRSSVDWTGRAAECGADSIRAWLVGDDGQPLGSKVQSWVTRVSGWETRLVAMLRKLWGMGNQVGTCPTCGTQTGVFIVKKDGANKGRLFTKCLDRNCAGHSFKWLAAA